MAEDIGPLRAEYEAQEAEKRRRAAEPEQSAPEHVARHRWASWRYLRWSISEGDWN